MSVMGFQKSFDGGWVGGVSSIQILFRFKKNVTLQSTYNLLFVHIKLISLLIIAGTSFAVGTLQTSLEA